MTCNFSFRLVLNTPNQQRFFLDEYRRWPQKDDWALSADGKARYLTSKRSMTASEAEAHAKSWQRHLTLTNPQGVANGMIFVELCIHMMTDCTDYAATARVAVAASDPGTRVASDVSASPTATVPVAATAPAPAVTASVVRQAADSASAGHFQSDWMGPVARNSDGSIPSARDYDPRY